MSIKYLELKTEYIGEKITLQSAEVKAWYFLHRYGKVEQITIETDRVPPFVVSNKYQKFLVFVYDWKKSIGTNTIIRIDNRINDMFYYQRLSYDGVIIIGNRFSPNAYDIVKRLNKTSKVIFFLLKQEEVDQILTVSEGN